MSSLTGIYRRFLICLRYSEEGRKTIIRTTDPARRQSDLFLFVRPRKNAPGRIRLLHHAPSVTPVAAPEAAAIKAAAECRAQWALDLRILRMSNTRARQDSNLLPLGSKPSALSD